MMCDHLKLEEPCLKACFEKMLCEPDDEQDGTSVRRSGIYADI